MIYCSRECDRIVIYCSRECDRIVIYCSRECDRIVIYCSCSLVRCHKCTLDGATRAMDLSSAGDNIFGQVTIVLRNREAKNNLEQ